MSNTECYSYAKTYFNYVKRDEFIGRHCVPLSAYLYTPLAPKGREQWVIEICGPLRGHPINSDSDKMK